MLNRFFPNRHSGWKASARHGAELEIVHVTRGADARPRLRSACRVPGELLPALQGEVRRLRGGRLSWLLQASEYQFLQVDTPDVPEAEQRAALRWQLKDVLHQGVDDSIFDIMALPPTASARGRPPTLVVAAARSTLAPTVQAFQAARLALSAIDVPEMALRNIAILHDSAPRGLALLHFDDSGGLVVLCHEGELVTSRRFDIGAPQLALADEQRLTRYERLGLELQRSFDNFDRQYSHIPLARLLVSAPPAAASIVDFLASTLYLPVVPLELAALVDDAERLDGCSLLTLGAALRSEAA